MTFYNHVYSLGPFCHTGNLLQRLDVKKESYPFDWICTNLNTIIHCIENDFKIFLDKKYYNSDIKNDKIIHTYYNEHFNGKGSFDNIKDMTDEKYDYFIRCVDRFRKLLHRPKRKMRQKHNYDLYIL